MERNRWRSERVKVKSEGSGAGRGGERKTRFICSKELTSTAHALEGESVTAAVRWRGEVIRWQCGCKIGGSEMGGG